MTIKKWLLDESTRISNLPPYQKKIFFQWVKREAENTFYYQFYKIVIEQNQTLFLKLIIKKTLSHTTDSDLEKIINLSTNVKNVFIRVAVYIIIQHAIGKISDEENKNTILRPALKEWRKKVSELKIKDNQNIYNELVKILIMKPYPISEDTADPKDHTKIEKLINPTHRKGTYFEFTNNIPIDPILKELFEKIPLSEEEITFIVDFFSKHITPKYIPDNKIKDLNKLMKYNFKGKKLYTIPTIEEAEELLKEKDPVRSRDLQEKFQKKYTDKQLTVRHIDLLRQAMSEIELINTSMLKAVEETKKPAERLKKGWRKGKWKDGAIRCFHLNEKKFNLVKSEYLQDGRLYELMDTDTRNRPREMYGEIMNKVFKAGRVEQIDKKVIYQKVSELKKTLSNKIK